VDASDGRATPGPAIFPIDSAHTSPYPRHPGHRNRFRSALMTAQPLPCHRRWHKASAVRTRSFPELDLRNVKPNVGLQG